MATIDARTDFTIENHGSIFLLRPHTDAAREWIDDNIGDDAMWFAGAVAVEHRYIDDIAQGISDGLSVA